MSTLQAREILTREVETGLATESNELFQSAFWARFKQRQGYRTRAFHLELTREHRSSSMVMIFRPCGGDSFFGYVPYGPDLCVSEEEHGILLEEIAEDVRPKLPERCDFLRFDLPWRSPYSERLETGDRELPSDRIRELRMNFAGTHHNLRKAPIDMQPPDTVVIDLYQSSRSILRRMKSKTRYNLRRAFKNGVSIRAGGGEILREWYGLYENTAWRKGFVCEDFGYFRRLFETASDLQIDLRIYLAELGEEPLGGIIVAHYAGSASYLFGASTDRRRTLMPSYALQWRAMMDAKYAGCIRYDMFGIPPAKDPHHPMYGLYRFKTGFGGEIVHLRGCWDYPFDVEKYRGEVEASAFLNPYHR